jgi:pyridoxine 4-dehydrogenase
VRHSSGGSQSAKTTSIQSLTGRGIWGAPSDRHAAIATLRRLPEIGVNFIDTADSCGPDVSETLIREALHPYEGLLIATKAGLTRPGPDPWTPNGQSNRRGADA